MRVCVLAVAAAACLGARAEAVKAYSMLTHDGRRLVSHVEGTNTVFELVHTNALPANLPPVREWTIYAVKGIAQRTVQVESPAWIMSSTCRAEECRGFPSRSSSWPMTERSSAKLMRGIL